MFARRMHAPLVVLLLLVPSSLLAWGGKGHAIVGAVAEAGLSADVAAQIHDLLPGQRLRDIASLPDDWRAQESRHERPGNTFALHFVNIPNDVATYDAARDCPTGECVVAAIDTYRKILADRTQPKEKRHDALIFIVHFLGDIHQPLHCTEGQVPPGTKDRDGNPVTGDQGGNLIKVSYLGGDSNLHKVWDSQIIEWGPVSVDDYVKRLFDYELRGRPVEELQRGTPVDWANESHYASVHNAYALPADGKILSDYPQRNLEVVYERLLRAGLRLRRVLEETLGTTAGSAPAH
jgi:hypothetical protein